MSSIRFRPALVFLGTLVLAASAASLRTPVSEAAGASEPRSASFSVEGSNGFRLDVESAAGRVTVIASERRPPVPTFSVSGRPRRGDAGNGASSTYYARGRADAPGTIAAALGELGRIDVVFHPSGRSSVTVLGQSGSGCRPARIVRRLGVFAGTITFRGENGYTTVTATRARGSVGTPLPTGCTAGAASASAAPKQTRPGAVVLAAADRVAGSTFRASTGPGGIVFRAAVEETSADGVVVVRRAYAGAPTGSFRFDRSLSWARVRPPAPFSGAAKFSSGREPSWTGTLRVTFPGLSAPLTGANFEPILAAGR